MTSTSSSSPSTPPWMSELLAMNRKVVRNLSTSSYFLEGVNSSGYSDSTTKVTTFPIETASSLKSTNNTEPRLSQILNSTPVESTSKAMNSNSSIIDKMHRYGARSVSSDEQSFRRTRGLNTANGSATVTGK